METTNLAKTNGQTQVAKLPTLSELVDHNEDTIKQNQLMVLLNQEPPEKWLKTHPMVKDHKYMPINRVEFLLSAIFGKWWVEVKETKLMANSVAVTVRLHVVNPLSGLVEYQEGVGAAPVQTDKDRGATDWNYVKSAGVQMALPIAKSYAVKDAAELFGKLFGKDLNRKDIIQYDSLLTKVVDYEEIAELFELKKDSLSPQELKDATRILKNKETNAYNKLFKHLQGK